MNNGENGFKVLRRFPANKEYTVGEMVNANEAINIPIRNRIALEKSGYIEFLAEPSDKNGFETLLKENKELKDKVEDLLNEIEVLKSEKVSDESTTDAVAEETSDVVDTDAKLPTLEEIEAMDDEEIKNSCIKHNIEVGNKRVKTLKKELSEFIKKEEVNNA